MTEHGCGFNWTDHGCALRYEHVGDHTCRCGERFARTRSTESADLIADLRKPLATTDDDTVRRFIAHLAHLGYAIVPIGHLAELHRSAGAQP